MADRLILPISENSAIVKARLIKTLNELGDEFNRIHDLYDNLFSAQGDKPSLAREIETTLETIATKYSELFDEGENKQSKIDGLNQQIEKIKEFHATLVDGAESIESDVKRAQKEITDFYAELFSTYEEEGDGGRSSKLKSAFESITSFDEILNKEDVGYKAKVEKAKNEILAAHKNLLAKDQKTGLSKVDLLDQQIASTGSFHSTVEKEIAPFIKQQQELITSVAKDIKTKQSEVEDLLSETTVKTLAQGYREAMQIYGDPVYEKGKEGKLPKHWIKNIAKGLKHFVKFIGSYVLFVGPLILIGWLFVSNGWQGVFTTTQDGAIKFSGTEYIFYKLTIAIPLLWVSWYGQRSIAHRKRLFEEYNHKLRVVQMYMLFTNKSETYALEQEAKTKLEATLMDTIERNPSSVYGKDETFVDKVVGLFEGWVGRKKNDATPPMATVETSKKSTPLKSKTV